MDLLIHFQGFNRCTCWNTYMSPREQDADMWTQPQRERPSAVKSRWGWGLKVWSVQVQHIGGKFSRRKWLSADGAQIWDAYRSRPWWICSFVTHTFLICQISHKELPTPLWVKHKQWERQSSGSVPGATSFWSLPALLFPTPCKWWFSTKGPDPA